MPNSRHIGPAFEIRPIIQTVFLAKKSRGEDQRLADRPPHWHASQSLIVRHAISASEKRCG